MRVRIVEALIVAAFVGGILAGVLAIITGFILIGVAMAQTEDRYTYQAQVVGGVTRCVERYEIRETDLDSTVQVTTQRRDQFIIKADQGAALNAEKAELVAKANAIQSRINALNAAGCP